MMNGNYGGGWMWGGWMMFLVVLVCIAIIGVVVWLVMRSQKNQQTLPLSSLPQQQPSSQMNEGYQPSRQQPTETYQEGEKQYTYPQSVQYTQQERPLN